MGSGSEGVSAVGWEEMMLGVLASLRSDIPRNPQGEEWGYSRKGSSPNHRLEELGKICNEGLQSLLGEGDHTQWHSEVVPGSSHRDHSCRLKDHHIRMLEVELRSVHARQRP